MRTLYKIIIVEDEDDIRHGLACLIDWDDLGFVVADTFCDGETAKEYLKNNHIDVVLTDIYMNGISGLDLAAWICHNMPCVRILVLSGYSDFKYAQLAIDCKVYKYLLKPTEPIVIRRIFKQLYNDLKETGQQIDNQKQAYQFSLESFLRMMIRGEFDRQKISWVSLVALGRSNDIGWIVCKLACAGIIDNVEAMFYNAFEAHDIFCIIPTYFDGFIIILAIPKITKALPDLANMFEKHLDKVIYVFRDLLNIRLSVITFSFSVDYSGVENFLIDKEVDEKKLNVTSLENREQISNAIKCIEDFNISELVDNVDKYNREVNQSIGFLLLARLDNLTKQSGKERLMVSDMEYKRILNESDEQLILEIKEIIRKIELLLSKKPLSIIEKVCSFIDNRSGKVVTLNEAAAYVYVSPSYLSRIFSEKMGISMKTYAIIASVNHAKELLENTDLKVYDIVGRLGYKDIRHFYSIFYKHAGTTPTQFRKALLDMTPRVE